MSRKGSREQNDISLIIGTLPKRLQNKIAASCSHAATTTRVTTVETENAENAEPVSTTTNASRPVTILSNSAAGKPIPDPQPQTVLVASGKLPRECGIPGILRVATAVAGGNGNSQGKSGHNARRRGRNHPGKDKEHAPQSPVTRTRLTTEHPDWFEPLLGLPQAKNVVQLYDQLMVLHQRNLILVNWKNFCYIHDQLQDAFKQLLLEQLKFVCEHKVDVFFWKLLFYNVRDYLKRQQSDQAHVHTLLLIEQATKFYRLVYDKLMAKCMASSRCESALKVVAQRLLICLGDLSRYRVNHVKATDYLEAAKYYQRAQELVPGNGAPYNQLAVISIYHHKRFDAVYYYVRSLLTSNSIQTAKESLLDLFDEIRRKYEESELKQSPMHYASPKNQKSKQMRKEVWIYPDGIRRLHRTDEKGNKAKGNKATLAEVNRYEEMAAEELLPRIVSLYLYLIGKLYTGTDVDSLYPLLRKLQIQISAALKHKNLLSRSKLLKIVALNLFVVEHNKRKTSRREMRYHSFNFANSFFGLVLKKTNELLSGFVAAFTNIDCLPEEDFTTVNTYLQYVKVYVHWLSINVDVWEPVRTEEHSFIDCWAEISTLFEHIECVLGKQKLEKKEILLDEDIALSGFNPLGRETMSKNCIKRAPERIQFIERIRRIAQFQNCYVQHQDLLQQPLDSSFTIEDLNVAMKNALENFDAESCGLVAKSSKMQGQVVEELLCPSTDADVSELCKLKKELEAKAKVKQICNSKLQEILKFVDTKIYIEVRPRYLLPDTNCFIDCLEDFEKLATEFKRYTLIIPLTVVKELDGLSKGVKLDSYRSSKQTQRIHHFDEVSSRAKKSLEFIKSAKSNVKCATTKGSFVNSSVFALVEEEYLSNDDKILATAVAVSKTAKSEQCTDGKCFIQTELVLITTDRNLRVKALSRNLAVSALDEFLQWAKDCREST
ncbi:telomerase-binding protein EST1A isoform X2 [Drosophila ficusphila]|uniref:telomerase-binding protein EST1A isoform X2 n=1 Tax=Drosophila ficusphila TaxID=30025 RepID=UPI001C88ECF3|nr:telomerase-binding protein EST1A isoform X2 [Drosophila ficusphila]